MEATVRMALTDLRVTAFLVIREFFAKQVRPRCVLACEIYCGSDIGECTSAPCQNNGTCVDEINRFTCNCSFGYTGDHCETSNCCVFDNELFVETLLSIEILMNVHLRLAKTVELASMELTCTRVCA